MNNVLKNRYDILLFFRCQDSNPNGDPDRSNRPRQYGDDGIGYVSDVCIKRKIRNGVYYSKYDEDSETIADGFDLFVGLSSLPGYGNRVLNDMIREALNEEDNSEIVSQDNDIEGKLKIKNKPSKKDKKSDKDKKKDAQMAMCEKYYDIRAFGAVLNTGDKLPNVRGPVQCSLSRSVWPIEEGIIDEKTTRGTTAKEKEDGTIKASNFCNKYIVKEALYKTRIHIDPIQSKQTGFSNDDFILLIDQLCGDMFTVDRSHNRTGLNTEKVIIFKHASKFGNMQVNKLFQLVDAKKEENNNNVEYTIKVDKNIISSSIEIYEIECKGDDEYNNLVKFLNEQEDSDD